MSEVVLEVQGLRKGFQLFERDRRFTAFEGVDFSVRAGSVTVLVGPSGSGKSSVLRCIFRTYLPDGGSAMYRPQDGEVLDLMAINEHRVLQLRRRELSFVTQFLHCLPRKSALDVVARPLLQLGESRAAASSRAAEMLGALGIAERLWELPPATFSGGEKQRVNIARGLITAPRLLLLDEPTASLDADAAARVLAQIERTRDEGAGVLATFHDPALIERLADEIVHLDVPAEAA